MFFKKNPFARSGFSGKETPAQRARRLMMLFVLVIVVGLLFWSNQQKRLREISAGPEAARREEAAGKERAATDAADASNAGETPASNAGETPAANAAGPVSDATGALSGQQLAALEEYARRFESRYGMRFVLSVGPEACAPQAAASYGAGVFYLGLCPEAAEAAVHVPPLMDLALGRDFAQELRAFFIPHFKNQTWPQGLAEALSGMTARLEAVIEQQEGGPEP